MATFTQMVEVNAFGVAAYPATAQVIFDANPAEVFIVLEDVSDDVYVSLDGTDNHYHLVPQTPSAGFVIDRNPPRKFWVKRGAAGANPTTVTFVARY